MLMNGRTSAKQHVNLPMVMAAKNITYGGKRTTPNLLCLTQGIPGIFELIGYPLLARGYG